MTAMDINDITLPCKLIDIGDRDESFALLFDRFDEGQTDHSIRNNGLSGRFKIVYKCSGINCCFDIDLTIGNLYYFNYDLDTAWDIYFGRNAKAVLRNYGDICRSELVFSFDESGRCTVSGKFMNSECGFRNGISFEMKIDGSQITDQTSSMDSFFDKLDEIQGNRNFN